MNPMNQMIWFPMYPFLPNNCEKPPTLYSIMESICNYDTLDPVKTEDLSIRTHSQIFDFTYPLSSKVNKGEFECMILDNFIMRRIGFETYTAFKIALKVKLRNIMPNYNILFDDLLGWDLFDNGEKITREVHDNRITNNNTSLNATSSAHDTSDRRYSNLPNNRIDDVKDGKYLTEYNYDDNNGTASSTSTGTNTTNDNGNLTETITRSTNDEQQVDILRKFLQTKQDIYSMIFKDLDTLFYQLD